MTFWWPVLRPKSILLLKIALSNELPQFWAPIFNSSCMCVLTLTLTWRKKINSVWSAEKHHISGIYFNKVAQIIHINWSEIAMRHTANYPPPPKKNLKTRLEAITCDKMKVLFVYHLFQRHSLPVTASFNYLPSQCLACKFTEHFRMYKLQRVRKTSAKNINQQPGADWDQISGQEISHSSRSSHTPTTNSETWTTLLAYLYDHHIKRSKSLVAVENN